MYKFQLNYRECFLQAPMAFRDAEFTLKCTTIGSTWEEASETFKIISTLFGCRFTALWGHYWYVSVNLKSFLLSSTSQRSCSLKSAPASVHGAISKTPPPNNRPGHPFKLENFTFSPQRKPRCKQRIVKIGSNLLIQIRISSCVVKYHSKVTSLGKAEGSYSNSWQIWSEYIFLCVHLLVGSYWPIFFFFYQGCRI